ncbi:hypothetical protein TPHA_0B02970 [Tetrapisispora phaffii CBS 4417]|uniref:t-SNARE coiled-coil homology domain-containing protein n=1 Tax=Tetrapisispora phaffii (strain ATCC 24235 / CBS 4417 / NBRC 1672 / NRRL Y-8282 / UCD 70-5) TaxID=1071381 RepID=G8BPN8_TETPH|nr:hypothetical protein TPHA_0B02970 [Tetrapisispora phaffii CBS 4417]CCE61969.1 hypothetical protein TPHA_0B02970 [Tetrapisispora phaffii CBS 4417]
MSFIDIESQKVTGDRPDERISNGDIEAQTNNSQVVELVNMIKLLKREVNKIGSPNDNIQVRNKIDQHLIPELHKKKEFIAKLLENSIGNGNGEYSSVDANYRTIKLYREQISSDLEGLLKQFEMLKLKNPLKTNTNVNVKHSLNIYNNAGDNDPNNLATLATEQIPDLQQQEQKQVSLLAQSERQLLLNEDELSYQSIIQQERGEEINKIRNKVGEVNTIFKQLSELVTEQSDQIDSIDNNINSLSDNLQVSNKALNKAEESQRKKNRCGFVVLVVLLIISSIILLAML